MSTHEQGAMAPRDLTSTHESYFVFVSTHKHGTVAPLELKGALEHSWCNGNILMSAYDCSEVLSSDHEGL